MIRQSYRLKYGHAVALFVFYYIAPFATAQAGSTPAIFCAAYYGSLYTNNTVANKCVSGPQDANYQRLATLLLQMGVDVYNQNNPPTSTRTAEFLSGAPSYAAFDWGVQAYQATVNTTNNSDSCGDVAQGYQACVTNIVYSTVSAQLFTYCPYEGTGGRPQGNFTWTCQASIVDRVHDKPKSCPASFGHPIYPLIGSKGLREEVGSWSLGSQPLVLAYDTRRRVAANDPMRMFTAFPAVSFGELWVGSLHKSLLIQTDAGGVKQAIQAARGAGAWVSFVRDVSGNYAADGDVPDRLVAVSGGWRYIDAAERAEETYDAQGKIVSTSFANGASLTYAYSNAGTPANVAPSAGLLITVQDQLARAVQFQYEQPNTNQAPRIKQVIDPQGQVIGVLYDASNNLAQLNWPDGKSRQYLYERADIPWALTGVVDENASRLATYGYDAQGRANDTQWAGGVDHFSANYTTPPMWNIVETYDSAANVIWRDHFWTLPQGTVITRPNGSASSLSATLVLGMPRLTSQSRAAGSGCAASTSAQSYDVNGNKASADDFNGSRACYVSDLSRNLETTRVEGLSNTADCSSVTPTNAVLPAGSRKVSTAWHPDWRLSAKVAEPGRLTTSVYNGQPDPFNSSAIASCAPAAALLPDGKPIAVLCKQVEQATTDANGSRGTDLAGTATVPADPNYVKDVLLLHMDDAAGGLFTDASSSGKVPSNAVAPLAIDTANAKYGPAAGNFTGGYLWYADAPDWDMAGGDFTIESWVMFNTSAVGSRVFLFGKSASNGANNTITIGKDTSDKLWVPWTTTAGSSSITDTAAVLPNTWYHVAIVRSGGTLTLWKNGINAGSAAISGAFIANTNHFSVGALGEYTSVYGSAYGTKMMGWLDEFRLSKGIARYAGAFTPPTTMFGGASTVLGIPSALDAAVPARTQQWTYNAVGQVLTAKDPLNNTTTYAYYTDTVFTGVDPNAVGHTLGDLQSVTNAVGKVTSYTKYNKVGQVLEQSDPNGVLTVNSYDLRQRLLSTSVGGQTTGNTYDAAGQLTRVTAPDLSWIGYEYDAAHRQTAVLDNVGNRIEYTLDNAGNKTAQNVKDPGGALKRTLARSIDALGRVQQTTGRE